MKRKDNNNRLATIDIDATCLHVCVSSRTDDGPWTCETRSTVWREEASSLNCERGHLEIAEAMKRIGNQLKLSNVPTWIALSGGYCVTRVVTGDDQQVRTELTELEQRSSLYLSLGHGAKALAVSIQQTDARNRHALLSVVNQKTLDVLVAATSKVGMKLQRIEPAMVSLCRLVGHMRDDDSPPALVLSVDERGIDLGICHRGVLLLDYPPTSIDDPKQNAATVLRHLSRLRRYCRKHVGVMEDELSDIYLVGVPNIVSQLRDAFVEDGELKVHDLLDPWTADDQWTGDDNAPAWTMAGPLGLAMLRDERLSRPSPNLLDQMQADSHDPLSKLMRPLLLPLAASLLAVAAGWFAAFYQGSRCDVLEERYAALDVELRNARLLQARVVANQQMLTHYETLDSALMKTDWSQLTTHVAQCLPPDAWLDSFTIDHDGELKISGGSYSDDGVFEFVRWLGQVPHLTNIAVDGTQPGRFPGGAGTQFDVHGDIAGNTVSEDHNDDRS